MKTKEYIIHWIGGITLCFVFLWGTTWGLNISKAKDIAVATIGVEKWDVIMSHIDNIFMYISQIVTKLIN